MGARDPYAVLQVGPAAPWHDVRAAFWALARRYHADGTEPDTAVMAEVNAAYEAVEVERRLQAELPRLVPTGPGRPSAPDEATSRCSPRAASGSLLWRIHEAQRIDTPVLDFGQYSGWRIAEVAQHDPRYLRWLSRHSMGMRFRKVIEEVLGPDAEIGRRAAIIG